MSVLEQALAGAQRSTAAVSSTRSAFIIGNTGKLGEELLNVLLESPLYSKVCVGMRKPMRSHVPKLESVVVPAVRADWDPCAGMQRAPEELFLCIEPEVKSFWKIAKPYVAVSSAWAVDTLATMDDGVQVIGAARLRELVGDPMEGARRL